MGGCVTGSSEEFLQTNWTQLSVYRHRVVLNCTNLFKAVVKNGTLYINGGIQTYVDFGADGQQDLNTITLGISECEDPNAAPEI